MLKLSTIVDKKGGVEMSDETLEALLWAQRMQHPVYALECGFFDQDGKFISRMRYPMEGMVVARKVWVEELSNKYVAAQLLMIWADGSSQHIETLTKP